MFSERFRREVCPNKVDAAHWLEIHETLHRHGVASNATMLYGTIETLEERVEHLILLRESQRRSPGYNAFIPLAFHPDGNALSHLGWTSAWTTSACSPSPASCSTTSITSKPTG